MYIWDHGTFRHGTANHKAQPRLALTFRTTRGTSLVPTPRPLPWRDRMCRGPRDSRDTPHQVPLPVAWNHDTFWHATCCGLNPRSSESREVFIVPSLKCEEALPNCLPYPKYLSCCSLLEHQGTAKPDTAPIF